jgi:hypothetical protein
MDIFKNFCFILLLIHIFMLNNFLFAHKSKSSLHTKRHLKTTTLQLATTTTDVNLSEENNKHVTNITVKVGETATLKCSIDYKYENNAGVC